MPLFITFEGIEGCGKTTQLRRLANRLETLGIPHIVTREPGGCPIADLIRGILLDAANGAMVPLAELFLYAAARAQHVAEVIAPALAQGKVVICDRYCDATSVYQGHGRHIDFALISQLNLMATGGVMPNLTILLDCPVEVGLGRAVARINNTIGDKEERFERESLLFHERIRSGYLRLAEAEPDRFVVIDGNQGADAVERSISEAVTSRLATG